MPFRPTRAVIDLKALRHNFEEARRRIPKHCGILAMVKADAYGHGAVPVVQAFEKLGVTCLGVATIEEGMELREAGIRTQILVMGGLMGGGRPAARAMRQHHLTPVIHTASALEDLEEGTTLHLKLDTGMTRLGVTPQALPALLERLRAKPQVKLEGVMTHLAYRLNPEYTRQQTNVFAEMGEIIRHNYGPVPVWHVANSAAVLEGEPVCPVRPEPVEGRTQFWARPGIMLYGIPPYPEYSGKADLMPVMSLVSKVMLIKHVPAGTSVSYNTTFTTTRPSRIGVVPIGYADGYPWSVSGKAHVLVEGSRCPVLGRVTMDMIMIDLTDCLPAQVGSPVVLMGRQGAEEISADALAAWAGTIPYEIVCGISKRMPRIYA